MWAVGRFPDLSAFFEAGKELGFAHFELNHAVTSDMLDGLSLRGNITSVHEPCPADISTAELRRRDWLVSALEEENRRQGVLAIRRSIDLAHELGARVVIVHLGQVDIDPDLESSLVALYRQGRFDQPKYAQVQERLVRARAAQAPANMRSVRRSILELAEYAALMGICLGLENRFHYREIPVPEELDELLGLDCGETIGYWHDCGHAQVLQHLGFDHHEDWLRRFAGRMVGVHLHDVVGLSDHMAAGLGQIDWAMVARYLPASALRTCEFQPSTSPQQVAAGLRWFCESGDTLACLSC
jgi:sugar phosphate isomerase/epimerase